MSNNPQSLASAFLATNEQSRQDAAASELFATLKQRLKKVELEGTQYYVAEGDTLLDEDQLAIYAVGREKIESARRAGIAASQSGLGLTALAEPGHTALVGITHGGRIVRWKPDLILSYRVVKKSFGSVDRYNQIVENLRTAGDDWEQTCGVRFQHEKDLDGKPGLGPGSALFTVREIDADGAFFAAAFFPTDPVPRRRLLIDFSFYDPNIPFDRVGILRHELGHVLGFRHEHIRSNAPPICPDETTSDAIEITDYDPQSVMHYFCGGVGTTDLRITAQDRLGAQSLYGPPLNRVLFIDRD